MSDAQEENGLYGSSQNTGTMLLDVPATSMTPVEKIDQSHGHEVVTLKDGEQFVRGEGFTPAKNANDLSASVTALNNAISAANQQAAALGIHEHLSPMADNTSMADADLGKIQQQLNDSQMRLSSFEGRIALDSLLPRDRDKDGNTKDGNDLVTLAAIDGLLKTFLGVEKSDNAAAAQHTDGAHKANSVAEGELFTATINHGLPENVKIQRQPGQETDLKLF